jgi:hypothetical protein
MKKLSILLALILVTGATLQSCWWCHRCCTPTVSVYTDQQAFLSALGGAVTTYHFDEFQHLQAITNQLPGLTFANAVAYDEVNHPSQGSTQSRPNVLVNADGLGGRPITFSFAHPVRGVGFFNTSIHDRERVTFESERCGVIYTGELSDRSVNFLGVISSEPIASGQVVGVAPTNGSIFIDDFSFGNGTH